MLVSFLWFLLFIQQIWIEFTLVTSLGFQNKDTEGEKGITANSRDGFFKNLSQVSLSKDNSIYLTYSHLGPLLKFQTWFPEETPSLETWNLNCISLAYVLSFLSSFIHFSVKNWCQLKQVHKQIWQTGSETISWG